MKAYSYCTKWGLFRALKKIIPFLVFFVYYEAAHSQTNDSTRLAHKKLYRSQLYLKNNFFIGTSFGSSNRNLEDLDLQFFAIENLNHSRSSIRLEAGYFIKNNWALGLATRYGRTSNDINFLSAEGTPTAFQSAAGRYSLHFFSKNFVPLGNDSRFIIFANSSLGASWRNQVSETLSEGILQRSFTNSRQVELVI